MSQSFVATCPFSSTFLKERRSFFTNVCFFHFCVEREIFEKFYVCTITIKRDIDSAAKCCCFTNCHSGLVLRGHTVTREQQRFDRSFGRRAQWGPGRRRRRRCCNLEIHCSIQCRFVLHGFVCRDNDKVCSWLDVGRFEISCCL